MSRPRFRVEEYTVGWVCALPIELAAATEMLDEEHGESLSSQDATDTNMYSLGRIGEHKVVIVCLPAGRMGTSSATAVASQMKSRFVSVNIGLMVGIGGGVPSTGSDIRLGDVVISQPHMQHAGVVQYDFGKAGANGKFTRTGPLNAPPIVLLNAVSKFRSNYLRHKSSLSNHLSAIVTRLPRFASPATGSDILFEAAYNHATGSTCDECSKDMIVWRTSRGSEEIVIHYGTIASGNQVIKDGLTRDRLSMELGDAVLCFEMEAAGLMNSFPCLVIRGICDYADSHKNKKWQPYAAVTAAACAKELLSIIPVTEVTKASLVNEVTDAKEEQKAHRNCLNMLFLTNAYDDRASLISTKRRRVEGTCEWIKDDVLFQSWLNPGSQLLWITGGPGKGKTMMSIFLTEELAEVVKPVKDAKLIFYFCDYQDDKRNTAITILRGLLFQVLKQRPKLLKSIFQEFETETKARYAVSSLEALWRVFESMLRDPDPGTIYCVIDGLDECDEGSLQILITKLSDFFGAYSSSPNPGEFKLIVVSRELPRFITAKLSQFPWLKLDPDSDDQVNSDIKRFISTKVDELSVIEGFNTKLRIQIVNTLLKRAEGTFLWVGFVTNELLQKDTCTEVVETLEHLPKGLPGIYSRMLLQIKEDRRSVAASILRWVVMALRPLTLAELATAINPKFVSNLSSDQVIRDCVRSCGAFVKMTEDRVGLVHQSVRDYLIRHEPDNNPILEAFRIKQEESNLELARTCFDYIQNEAVSSALIMHQYTAHSGKFPLLDYAALHWPQHARRSAALGEELFDLSGPFFRKKSLVFTNWWIWYRSHTYASWKMPKMFSLLHLASYLGILPLARKLLAKKSWWERFQKPENEKDSTSKTPLMYAAQYGHKTVVQLLLDSKADVSTKGNDGQTVLHQVASKGDKAVVQLLLDRRADVNAKDNYGRTALYLAAEKGREAVVQQLLDSKANVNARVNDGLTALHSAAIYGSEAVVQQLLYSKADVNAKDNDGETAMHRAALYRREAVVAQLLYSEADVNAKDNNGVTALHVAAGTMHKAVVAQLLYSKADVNAKDNNGETALHWAAMNGYKGVVQQLLDSKADVNVKNNDGQTELYLAARSGYKGVVQKLLDSTVDINAKDNYGETALHMAARYGRKAVVEQLIYSTADVNAKTINGQTALDLAAEGGHNAVMGLLKSALCL